MNNMNLLYNKYFFNWLFSQMGKRYYVIYNKESVGVNAKKIPLLYKLVDNYAKSNDLTPTNMINYSIYNVNYNGYLFSIFEHITETNYEYGCYANSKDNISVLNYINLSDIKNNDDIYSVNKLIKR